MKLAEILESLHRMQKETTKLLFEIPVNDNGLIRGAVAEADLTLGNAAAAVRRHLSRNRIICGSPAAIRADAREPRSAFRPAVPPATKQLLAQAGRSGGFAFTPLISTIPGMMLLSEPIKDQLKEAGTAARIAMLQQGDQGFRSLFRRLMVIDRY